MKENQQINQAQIRKMLNFAQNLRSKIIIPSIQLQNLLNYQYSQITKKGVFTLCTVQRASINKGFKRAYKTMNLYQKVNYYLKSIKFILKQIYSTNKKSNIFQNQQQQTNTENQTKPKFQKLTILIKKQGSFKKWITTKIQFAAQICVLRLVQYHQQLDLHNYILRKSKSKEKQSLVLQSTDETSLPTTLRISNNNQSLQELRNKIQNYIDKGLRQKISRLLKKNRTSFTTFRSSIQGQIVIPYKQTTTQYHEIQNQNKPATLILTEGQQPKSMRKIILQSSKKCLSQSQCKRIYKRLISQQKLKQLNYLKQYQQIQPNIFYNKKNNIIRRIFIFQEQQISYQWLVQSINSYKMYKKWKQSLYLINLLAEFPQQKTKIYHEINLYKNYNQVDYVYLKHLFQYQNQHYYIDKSINTEEYGTINNGSRGWIDYCLWRFRKNINQIQVLVEIQIKQNNNKKYIKQQAIQYIGQLTDLKKYYDEDIKRKSSTFKTVHNFNLFLFQDQSEFNILSQYQQSPTKLSKYQCNKKTEITQQKLKINLNQQNKVQTKNKLMLSNKNNAIEFPSFLDEQNLNKNQNLISNQNYEQSFSETQYFSIDNSQSQDQQISSSQQNIINSPFKQNNNQKFQSSNQNHKYLYFQHVSQPKPKNLLNKTKQTTPESGHFIWRHQWKITDKGQLININQEQIKVQSSVLKLVAKRMGRNLLAGKSVLNVSLPIQIFGTDSNLQRLCKSMAYGPVFLQMAAKFQSPVQKMKRVICFALGFGICYIEMQKPFNPILGQTYQGLVDDCPIYGQQISHHPPISTILLKGRGYTVYGNLQAKVQMGLNSASGINDGIVNVSFDYNDNKKNQIKFTCPPGQISGLVMGQRKLSLIKKTYYIDEQNMILGIIQWGSQKKKNQISFNNDYFDGQIIKLKPNTDLTKVDKIKEPHYEKVLSEIKGRWTGKVYFDNQLLFDVQKDGPYKVQQYQYPLQSNVAYRQDIIIRKQNNFTLAQQAKQKLQQIQRNDRKLRKKYQKDH